MPTASQNRATEKNRLAPWRRDETPPGRPRSESRRSSLRRRRDSPPDTPVSPRSVSQCDPPRRNKLAPAPAVGASARGHPPYPDSGISAPPKASHLARRRYDAVRHLSIPPCPRRATGTAPLRIGALPSTPTNNAGSTIHDRSSSHPPPAARHEA